MRSSPKSRDYLVALIEKEIAKQGLQADLNHLDVSRTENMDFLFVQWPDFNGDISRWDVSNVKSMRNMFEHCAFNGDISQWDVSKVANMQAMFRSSAFNQDISGWNPLHVSYFNEMFEESAYAHPLFLITPHPLQHGRGLEGMLYRSEAVWTPQPFMGVYHWIKALSPSYHVLTEHQYRHNPREHIQNHLSWPLKERKRCFLHWQVAMEFNQNPKKNPVATPGCSVQDVVWMKRQHKVFDTLGIAWGSTQAAQLLEQGMETTLMPDTPIDFSCLS